MEARRGRGDGQISASNEGLGVGVELGDGRETSNDGLNEVGTEPEKEEAERKVSETAKVETRPTAGAASRSQQCLGRRAQAR